MGIGTLYLAVPVSMAIFALLGRQAMELRKERRFQEFWGSLFWAILPIALTSILWAGSTDSTMGVKLAVLGLAGASLGATLFVWLGYVYFAIVPIVPSAAASQSPITTNPGKNNPNLLAGRDINIGHLGDVIQSLDPAPKAPKYAGILEPKVETLLSGLSSSGVNLEIGDSGAIFVWAGLAGTPVISFFKSSHLIVERIDGRVKVSTQIHNDKGELVAELSQNEWKVAPPPKIWDRNYSDDALEVRQVNGNVVLQVRALADRIQIQGEWWNQSGNGVRLSKYTNPKDGTIGGVMSFLSPGNTHDDAKINQMFLYPSELHFGKLANR